MFKSLCWNQINANKTDVWRRWEDGIEMEFRVWSGFTWLRKATVGGVMNAVMNLRVLAPQS
jgi:hypothetical protein